MLNNVTLYPKDILALVGRNGSSKAKILKALQLFFDASQKLVNKECFYNHNTAEPITILITFKELSDWEKEQFKAWIDGEKLIVGRKIRCSGEDYNPHQRQDFGPGRPPLSDQP